MKSSPEGETWGLMEASVELCYFAVKSVTTQETCAQLSMEGRLTSCIGHLDPLITSIVTTVAIAIPPRGPVKLYGYIDIERKQKDSTGTV